MMILKSTPVSKTYKGQKALDNFEICLEEGEIAGLIGPNGAGKTTLMKIIVDLIRKYDGCTVVNNLAAKTNPKLYRRHIGAVIETPGFYPYWSGLDNLKFFASLVNVKDIQRIEEVVSLLGLQDAINKKVSKYSLGMKQRLAIARALLHKPKLLILDEPTNGLDPEGVSEMRHYIHNIAKKQQVAILIASHVLSEIEKVCDKVYIIKKGKLIEILSLNDSSRGDTVVFHSKETDKIVSVAKDKGYDIRAVKDASFVRIYSGSNEVSEMIREFTVNNILLTGVHKESNNLEEMYFSAVGGNNIE